MKIIYKKPILDQIHAAIHEAKTSGKEIDHIHLTQKEAHDLRKACGVPSSLNPLEAGSILGVPFTVDKDELRDEIGQLLDSLEKHIFSPAEKHKAKA